MTNGNYPLYLTSLTNLIDGQLVSPTVSLESSNKCANTGADLGPKLSTDKLEIERALKVADDIHKSGSWFKLPSAKKEAHFKLVSDIYKAHHDEIVKADCVDIGVLEGFERQISSYPIEFFKVPVEKFNLNRTHEWKPVLQDEKVIGHERFAAIGPVVVICPSNAPIGSSMIQIMRALFNGCPVIAKPSPSSPHSFNVLAKIFNEANFPAGVFQIVHGDVEVAQSLIKSISTKAVCFTGSSKAGIEIAKVCSTRLKKFEMELGGINPFLVLKDADLESASKALSKSLTTINGMYCCGPSKVIVHEDIKDKFIDLVLEQFKLFKLGDSLDPDTTLGPICEGLSHPLEKNIKTLLSYPDSKLIDAQIPLPTLGGKFFQPSLIDNVPFDTDIELFGPVATIHSFKTIQQAIEMANSASSRLKTYIFGSNQDDIFELKNQIDCGWFDVNVFDMSSGTYDFSELSGFGKSNAQFFTRQIFSSFKEASTVAI
ncbi:Aldehyde/histidinol dehydrogenase [Globomyces pollinis-pini]|nr:Aldehyde/histidinol dehydrogenase [Globomyces pollinis-pini]